MIKRYIPILIAAVVMNACGPARLSTPTTLPSVIQTKLTIPASTSTTSANTASVPTNAPPPPTFATTFTPLPKLMNAGGAFLVNLQMMDETSGWAIEAGGWDLPNGGHILHTNDGASTWQDVTPPQGAYLENGFFALNATTAWASPFGLNCVYTVDTGNHCEKQNQVHVWMTQDGGLTWTSGQPICIQAECDPSGMSNSEWVFPKSIRFIDKDHGWFLVSIDPYAHQEHFKIYATADGGLTWKFVTANQVINSWGAVSLEPLDLSSALLTINTLQGAEDATTEFTYYASQTSKLELERVDLTPTSNLIGDPIWDELRCGTAHAESIPPLVLDFVQECYVRLDGPHFNIHFHSGDGAKTWSYWQQTGNVDFIDAVTGWQFSANEDSTFELEKTSDGGFTWAKIRTLDWDGQLNFVNELAGWALARTENTVSIFKTADGGATWEIQSQVEITSTPTPEP